MQLKEHSSSTSQTVGVRVVQLDHGKHLPLPKYVTELSAGMDLMAAIAEPLTLLSGERILVPTGLAMAIPAGYEAQVRPRSGLAIKHGIGVLNSPGTIDADYRGEVSVILINMSNDDFIIEPGMRIAQIVIAPVIQAEWHLTDSLDETVRGAGGFGHSGV